MECQSCGKIIESDEDGRCPFCYESLQRFDMHITIIDDTPTKSTQPQTHLDPVKRREAQMAEQFHQWLADKQILPGGLVIESPQHLAGVLAQQRFAFKLLIVNEPTFDALPLLVRSGFELMPQDYRKSLGFIIALRKYETANTQIHLVTWNILPPRIPSQLAYFRGAHGAFYLYDVMKKKALDPWPNRHEMVQQITGPIPSILIGHKEGTRGRRQIMRRQGHNLAKKLGVGYYETRNPKGPTLKPALEELVPQMFEMFQTTT